MTSINRCMLGPALMVGMITAMPAAAAAQKTLGYALSIWDTVEGRKEMTKMMLGMQIFMGIIGAMTLLIAGVGVANIMYVVIVAVKISPSMIELTINSKIVKPRIFLAI